MLKYAMFRVAEGLSRAIPRPFAYWISLRVADLYFFCDRRGRGAVSDNLRRVMEFGGQAATPALVRLGTRRTFQHFGKYVVDFFRFARLTEADIRRLVKIDHPEYVEQSLASRKGVILVTAHLGNWELGGAVLAGLGYPVNAVVLEQRSARLNEFFQHYRRRRGMAVIPLGHAVPQLIRALRRNECCAAGRSGLLAAHGFRHVLRCAGLPAARAGLAGGEDGGAGRAGFSDPPQR